MPSGPIVSTQQGIKKEIGGGDESLARRIAAAELAETGAKQQANSLGALIAGVAPTVLGAAGTAVGTAFGGPVGGAAGGAIGGGIGKGISAMDKSSENLQEATQNLENLRAEKEGRAARQTNAQATTEQAGSAIGSVFSPLVQKGVGSLISKLSIGG